MTLWFLASEDPSIMAVVTDDEIHTHDIQTATVIPRRDVAALASWILESALE